jgi:hypothetical protein
MNHRYAFALILLLPLACTSQPAGKHLFILSGQSNMARLDPAETFTPAVSAQLGADNVIVVKDAVGGQPIRRWYKGWRPVSGNEVEGAGDLYDRLMSKVDSVITGVRIQSVTFVWMQGERDAREAHGQVYGAALRGLVAQLETDLERDDLNVVIGRLSDFDMANAGYPHWTMVRDAQEVFAETHPRAVWVGTDDLNDGVNRQGQEINDDLHLSEDGYRILGDRFAAAATSLIQGRPSAIDLGQRTPVRQAPLCSPSWVAFVDSVLTSGDGSGHGPDLGSGEWKSVIEFKLGVRGNPEVPDRSTPAWCAFVDERIRGR